MFNVAKTPGRYTKFTGSFGQPQCWAELHIRFRDGSSEVVVTNLQWLTSPGPVTYSSTYGGESYDARDEPVAWDRPEPIDKSVWHPSAILSGPGGKLQPEITHRFSSAPRFTSGRKGQVLSRV
jgi:alpha-L-rhamnosidase